MKSDEKLKFARRLFLLKTFYAKILDIIEMVCNNYVYFRDMTLNQYYIRLLTIINDMLKGKGFENLKKIAPKLPENILGNFDNMKSRWEFDSEEDYFFLGEIEKTYILSRRTGYESILKPFEIFLGHIDGAMMSYKKHCDESWIKILKNAKTQGKENSKGTDKKIKKINHLITRDEQTGNFYYKNQPIEFDNKNAIYFLIFECLYEYSDIERFCSYEDINKYLEKHGKEKYEDWRQIIDRIKNGITNLFRFSNLPQNKKAPNGRNLIQKTRGEGLTLYNP